MGLENIERNSLDYILTDLVPVEISELFTYREFYTYLTEKIKIVDKVKHELIMQKNKTNSPQKLFESNGWVSLPLKYTIMKSLDTTRELNLVQPIAAIEIYLFIAAFEKEILNSLESKCMYSIRYHTKENDLYYKRKKKSLSHYFAETSQELQKGIIEQTGMYFNLKPFQSVISFTSSDRWYDLNLKYRFFAKLDYQACFDSIYTHTYKWILSKDVNDSKQFNNTNLYTTIDRIMQNINARTSNGIIVGPEFSRMIAEILLQGIDSVIFNSLLNEGIILDKNYTICRYVDDIFIFAESEEILEKIIKYYHDISQRYLLKMNQSKIVKYKLPCVLNPWLNQMSDYSIDISNSIFYSGKELKEFEDDPKRTPSAFKARIFFKRKNTLKRKFNDLVCLYDSNTKILVSYVLGTILNRITEYIGTFKIFKSDVTKSTIYGFLDYIFYIYSHFPNFDNTQKLISIINYINDEVNFTDNSRSVLQEIINKYAYVFDKANINDLINLLLLITKFKIELPYYYEMKVIELMKKEENPILWASFLLYSKYEASFFRDTKDMIKQFIRSNTESILRKNNILTYKEFWWIIIFNKCPHIDKAEQDVLDNIINSLKITNSNPKVSEMCTNLVVDFLLTNDQQFFIWDIERKDILKHITYRTNQRTVFKNFKFGQIEYCSID